MADYMTHTTGANRSSGALRYSLTALLVPFIPVFLIGMSYAPEDFVSKIGYVFPLIYYLSSLMTLLGVAAAAKRMDALAVVLWLAGSLTYMTATVLENNTVLYATTGSLEFTLVMAEDMLPALLGLLTVQYLAKRRHNGGWIALACIDFIMIIAYIGLAWLSPWREGRNLVEIVTGVPFLLLTFSLTCASSSKRRFTWFGGLSLWLLFGVTVLTSLGILSIIVEAIIAQEVPLFLTQGLPVGWFMKALRQIALDQRIWYVLTFLLAFPALAHSSYRKG